MNRRIDQFISSAVMKRTFRSDFAVGLATATVGKVRTAAAAVPRKRRLLSTILLSDRRRSGLTSQLRPGRARGPSVHRRR
jgi:hypothetical protein